MNNLQLKDTIDIPIGSHLVSNRDNLLSYDHHAIYIGDNKVIHYNNWIVRIDSLSDFLKNSPFQIMQHINPKYSNEEVKNRALSKLNEKKYNILLNNCEHFANWCIDGKKESRQAKISIQASIFIIAIAGITAIAAVVYKIFFKKTQATI